MTSSVLSVGVLVLLCTGSLRLARLVHGRPVGFSPLFLFLLVWSAQVALNVANPLGLDVPGAGTTALLGGAVAAFVCGYATAFRRLDRRPAEAGADAVSTRPAVVLAAFTAVAGGALFLLLMAQVVAAYGTNPAAALLALRIDLGRGTTPSGFYYFYFLTLFVPLAVVLARFTGRRLWYVPAAGATLALLGTSGRTNAITAMVWALSAVFLLRGARPFALRQVVAAGTVLVLALGGFLVLGSALGKTYENSVFATRFGQDPPVPAPLVLPLLYASAPVPTFDAQRERNDRAGGSSNVVRPVLQLVSVVAPRVEVPEKIQEFDWTPYPHNVATYASPLHRDGGVPGVLLGSWALGAVAGAALAQWLRRPTPALAVLVALLSTLCLATVNDAAFTELSVLVQATLVVLAVLTERRLRLRTDGRADGSGTLTSTVAR